MTTNPSAVSIINTPQAADDLFRNTGLTEDALFVTYLDVMANDLGGAAKTLYSVDDGTNGVGLISATDLLTKDTVYTGAPIGGTNDVSAHGARIWITADGKIGYDAATLSDSFKAQLQVLAAGTFLTDSFTYAIRLGNGTLSWATATVRIAGLNDAAVIGEATLHDVTEDYGANDTGNLTASGTIAISDVDQGQASFQTTVTAAAGNLGNLILAANGAYTYSVANSEVQFLGANEIKVDVFTVKSFDGTTKQVSFTINGANDLASITGSAAATLGEDDTAPVTGTLTVSDVDDGQAHAVTTSGTAAFGNYSVDTDGHWSYAVDSAAVQHLAAGTTATDSFTVNSLDGTASQKVSITINGANETPADLGGPTAINLAFGSSGDTRSNLGTFTASGDPDGPTDSITLGLGAGSSSSSGTGTASGFVLTGGILNATAVPAGASVLQVVATDQAGNQISRTFNVWIGGKGSDTTTLITTSGRDDIAVGLGGSDQINGTSGIDYISGGTADDTIWAGAGADWLVGGNGNDNFVYNAAGDSTLGAFDTILDFAAGATGSADKLDFSAFADAFTVQSVDFGNTTTTLGAHTIGWHSDGTSTTIYANTGNLIESITNGADMMKIVLQDTTGLLSGNIIG
jgi:VCBS repeat-containing protein